MSRETQAYIEQAEQSLLHTYNRYPIVFDRGEGMYLYDIEGKKYLDFCAGIAVYALGYNHPKWNCAVKEQLDKLTHTSNYFYHVPGVLAAQKLLTASGMDRVFFTNSGAEAIEGAIKTARKYAYQKDGCCDHEIIAMRHSFHGRTMGALSVTGNTKYQEAFRPMLEGVRFAGFNDLDSVKEQLNEKTCAILLEPIQGEGGIYPADPEFLKGLRALCDERDLLLIYDEVQCGMGRVGTMFAWQAYGVKPDVMAVAKAMGGGLPVGAFLCTEKASALEAGDHGSTYGGNPLVCAAVSKVFDIFSEEGILENVRSSGAYLQACLENLMKEFDCIVERRGMGLMQGLEFKMPVAAIIQRALQNGLVLIAAGSNTIRFLPPLIVKKEQIDEMISILKSCIN